MSYLLFAGDDYYPRGGAEDLQGQYNSIEEAISNHNPNEHNMDGGWANILNLDTLEIVKEFNHSEFWKEYIPNEN